MLPVSGAEQLHASGAILTPVPPNRQAPDTKKRTKLRLTPAHNLGHDSVLKVRERDSNIGVCNGADGSVSGGRIEVARENGVQCSLLRKRFQRPRLLALTLSSSMILGYPFQRRAGSVEI